MTRAAQALDLLTLAVVAALALRNALAIPVLSPLDPNEGWNAAHTLRWLGGGPLYPPAGSLMVNNYPPLSFYLVAAVTHLTGDAVLAGRAVAFAAFAATCGGIFLAARFLGAVRQTAMLGALFFAAALLVASDYVGIDDPQMLGHAVQIAALLMILRGRAVAAALLFVISLFIKHNLIALPLATALWLLVQDRRAGWRFLVAGAAFGGIGLAAFQIAFGTSLWSQLATPRQSSIANVGHAITHLWWILLPLAALWRAPALVRTYAALALILGVVFAAGDGVDANAFFDLAIALSLALAFARPILAAAAPVPLLLCLALTIHDNNFFFTRSFAAQSESDIAFLRARSGPALCSQLSLCLWAGKGAVLDTFNVGEAIASGARDPAPLVQLIEGRHFAVIQLDDPDALGPQAKAAIARTYRTDHAGDNGRFLIPAP